MSAVQEVGERLAEVFRAAVPMEASGRVTKGKAPSREAVARGLAKFYAEARAERAKRRLGIIGRARVALYLQAKLVAAGYPPELVRQVLFSMLVSAFVGRAE